MDNKRFEQTALDFLRLIADRVGTGGEGGVAAASAASPSVDQLISQSFGGAGFTIVGGTTSETLTIAGASGTLGIDITSGSGATVAYDEAFSSDVETTIDNWLVTNAAAMLAAHGITATKASASTILLSGNVRAGIYVFADGGATMTATSGGQTTVMVQETGPFHAIEITSDAVFDDAGTVVSVGDDLPFGFAAAAGDKIIGSFTSVKLVSGVARAYLI